jgi:transcription antitermination factor NusG
LWTVCSTKPGQLSLALVNLAQQGYHTFNPSFEKRKLDRRRKLVVVNEPLFPGYLFIEILKDQRWVPIRSTYGINKLLTRTAAGSEYLEPAVIADNFINDLMLCSTRRGEREWRLDPGTTVRIERGPFSQFTGTLASWNMEQLRALQIAGVDAGSRDRRRGARGQHQRAGVVAQVRRTMRGVPMPASGNSQTTGLTDQSLDF